MYIFGRRIYAGNDFIVKMWAGAAAIILVVSAILMWNDRFRERCETKEAVFSLFGVEIRGRQAANFTGSRGFVNKMNKLGLGSADRRYELDEMFSALGGNVENLKNSVPVLWLYAEGKTKEDRDRSVQTFGNAFFAPEKLCFSIVDSSGFSIQADPKTFRVLWAQDGGAIVAVPLLDLPPECAESGFVFRIEERGENGQWIRAGDMKIPPFSVPASVPVADDSEEVVAADENPETSTRPAEVAENSASAVGTPSFASEFFPQEISVETLTYPRECRFFSAPLWDHAEFGEIRVRLRGNESGEVPAAAWNLENFELRSPTQTFPLARADALHREVRFLENENFEDKTDGVLTVPVSKVLFPRDGESWTLKMRFFRQKFFPEDFFALPEMNVSKVKNAPPKTFSHAGTEAKIRAFFEEDYIRRIDAKVPALVVEIRQDAAGDAAYFWDVFRVKTDTGEDLSLESVVCVEPGARQYWFLPSKETPKKVSVVCAVTPYFYVERDVSPTVLAGTPEK